MADFELLQAEANRLVAQEPPALPEIRKLMVEMDEYFNSPDFQNLDREHRTLLQTLYKDLRVRVRGPEAVPAPATAGAFDGPGFAIPENGSNLHVPEPTGREHNPQA